MHLADKKDFIDLKEALSFSDFQMFIFLRVYELIKAYEAHTIVSTRRLITKYDMNMEWHDAFIEHVQGGKEVWKQ